MVDHSGFAIVEGGICTTLRDLARLGLMCLDDGRTADEQVVPAEWIARVRVRRSGPDRGLRDLADHRRPARPAPSTTTTGGSTTARAASTRRSG